MIKTWSLTPDPLTSRTDYGPMNWRGLHGRDGELAFKEFLAESQQPQQPKRQSLYIGMDLGEMSDHAALCVIQPEGQKYILRTLKRFALGTTYPDLVNYTQTLLQRSPLKNGRVIVGIDVTGMRAAFDMFKHAGINVTGISITSGLESKRVKPDEFHVPKHDLINTLLARSQEGRLEVIRKLKLYQAFNDELHAYKPKQNQRTGHVSYGAQGAEMHDDLLMSCAIAVWLAEHESLGKNPPPYRRMDVIGGRQ